MKRKEKKKDQIIIIDEKLIIDLTFLVWSVHIFVFA